MTRLPKYEYGTYFFIYSVFLFCGIYKIYKIRDDIAQRSAYDFAEGWKIIGRPRDDTNSEWENFTGFISKNFYWYIIQIALTEICRLLNNNILPFAHFIIGIAFILATYQYSTILIIFSQLLSFYCVTKFKRKALIWILGLIWLAALNILNKNPDLHLESTYEEQFELIMIIAWGFLKCFSYSIDAIDMKDCDKRKPYFNIIYFLGYTLYFPMLVFGPVMIFERYIKNEEKNATSIDSTFEPRLVVLLKDLTRVFFWLMFKEIVLHFLYINYLETDLQAVKQLNSWSFYGFGYLMGQLFHLHYVVTYGLAISIARFEGLHPPNLPKCIGRISFYSDMWKNFDQGLYDFLFKYIYSALCSKQSTSLRKMLASVATFSFIFVWHGMFTSVLIWTVLNFLCLHLEKAFKSIVKSFKYKKITENFLSTNNQIRLYNLLGSQIFIPSAISNFYFFADVDIGNYFIYRTYCGGFLNYFSLTFCCYCIFQCSELIWNLNEKRNSIS